MINDMKNSFLKTFLLTGFCLFTIEAVAATNPAIQQVTKPIYVWKTESEKDPETKAFDHCLVKNMYDNGTAVILAQNLQGAKRLALHFAERKMQKGQNFDLAIQVDRKDVFPVEAVAVNSQVLTIGIPEGLPDQMRKGQMLHIRGPNDEVIYDLRGMEGAVSSLQDCMIAQNANMGVAQTDDAPIFPAPEKEKIKAPEKIAAKNPEIISKKPVQKIEEKPVIVEAKRDTVSVPAELPKQKNAAIPAKPALTAQAITREAASSGKVIEVANEALLPAALQSIYNAAGHSPDKLIPMKPTTSGPLDYLWQKQSVFYGIKQKAVLPGDTIQKLSVDYLQMLRGRCKGNFLAESTSVQTVAASKIIWQATEAACSSTTKGDSIAAILFTVTPQGAQIFFFESTADQGAGAIKARDAVQAIVTQ